MHISQGSSDISTGSRQQRLKILSQEEIEDIYGFPHFTDEGREQYFTLSATEQEALNRLKTTKSKTAFILQLGYFKARHMFFIFSPNDIAADMCHIAERYFPDAAQPDCTVTKVTRLKQQGLILTLCKYKTCDDSDRQQLEVRAREAAVVSGKPIYVFRQILQFLSEKRIVSPAYSSLQNIVGKALTDEQTRMAAILKEHLTAADRKVLDTLLDDKSDLYHITNLRRSPKDFSVTEIKLEIGRGNQIRKLYELSQRALPALKIPNESIKAQDAIDMEAILQELIKKPRPEELVV